MGGAFASIETAEVTQVAAAPIPTGAIQVTKVAAAPAPTDAAKVTQVAAALGLTDVAGLLRQQAPYRRSLPSSARPLQRARERCPLPPGMSKPKSRPAPPWPPPDLLPPMLTTVGSLSSVAPVAELASVEIAHPSLPASSTRVISSRRGARWPEPATPVASALLLSTPDISPGGMLPGPNR